MYKVTKEIIPINHRFAKNYQLATALQELGNPQLKIPTINVVGTNGKGSVASGLLQGLQHKYKRVGLFISPAFLYHNERIQINGEFISDSDLDALLKEQQPIIQKYNLTFFEIWTLIMIQHFARNQVDIAIIEAGIGGLMDATKVMENQKLVVLTAVDYDHTNVLGNTISEIIKQKIGIAYDTSPIIVSADNLPYKILIETESQKKQLKLVWASSLDDPIMYQRTNKSLIKTALDFFECPLPNPLSWPKGRFTTLQNHPKWILDGAHNQQGIEKLVLSVKEHCAQPLILYGASFEKDYQKIIKYLESSFDEVYLTTFDHFKAWDLKKVSGEHHFVEWKEFLKAHQDCEIVICGSLYFVPQVYEWYHQEFEEKHDLLLNY